VTLLTNASFLADVASGGGTRSGHFHPRERIPDVLEKFMGKRTTETTAAN